MGPEGTPASLLMLVPPVSKKRSVNGQGVDREKRGKRKKLLRLLFSNNEENGSQQKEKKRDEKKEGRGRERFDRQLVVEFTRSSPPLLSQKQRTKQKRQEGKGRGVLACAIINATVFILPTISAEEEREKKQGRKKRNSRGYHRRTLSNSSPRRVRQENKV